MDQVTTVPVSDRITRERTYEIVQMRTDKKDAFAQLIITLWGIMTGKFTGTIVMNCSQGSVNNIKVTESRKV